MTIPSAQASLAAAAVDGSPKVEVAVEEVAGNLKEVVAVDVGDVMMMMTTAMMMMMVVIGAASLVVEEVAQIHQSMMMTTTNGSPPSQVTMTSLTMTGEPILLGRFKSIINYLKCL